jgi:hypothetical protein
LWIAVTVYTLVAIIKERSKLTPSVDKALPTLSLITLQRFPLYQLFTQIADDDIGHTSAKQSFLLD